MNINDFSHTTRFDWLACELSIDSSSLGISPSSQIARFIKSKNLNIKQAALARLYLWRSYFWKDALNIPEMPYNFRIVWEKYLEWLVDIWFPPKKMKDFLDISYDAVFQNKNVQYGFSFTDKKMNYDLALLELDTRVSEEHITWYEFPDMVSYESVLATMARISYEFWISSVIKEFSHFFSEIDQESMIKREIITAFFSELKEKLKNEKQLLELQSAVKEDILSLIAQS